MKNFDSILPGIQKSCKKFNVKKLEVFGSAARGDYNEDSDVDFLVEFEDLFAPNISDKYFGLLEELEKHCRRRVDLVEVNSITNPYFKQSIDRSRILIYGN
jgi:predicted nucleotidyltransferase